MRRNGWYVSDSDGEYILSRRFPARLDVFEAANFPFVNKARLANQVRQDLWRAMKHLRGFSPVIHIATTPSGLRLKAGGQCGILPTQTSAKIAELLEDPVRRARWIKCAKTPFGSADQVSEEEPIAADGGTEDDVS